MQILCLAWDATISGTIIVSPNVELLQKIARGLPLMNMTSSKSCKMIFRSSCLQVFFKINVLKHFSIFTGKRLCWSLFWIKLQDYRFATLFKRDSTNGVFCEYCEIFKFVYRTTPMAASGDWSAQRISSTGFPWWNNRQRSLHKKWSFLLRISSVNVTKSHLLDKFLWENFFFSADNDKDGNDVIDELV